MSWNIRGFLTSLATCIPLCASATPPDIINVHDEIFGISPTHVFLTRTAVDNLGTHGGNFTFVVLVGKDIATGHETTWPLNRYSIAPDYAVDDTGGTNIITTEPQLDARNPYAVVAEFGGHPVAAAFDWNNIGFWESNRVLPVPALTSEFLTLSHDGKQTHETATDVLFADMSASVTGLAAHAGEYWRFVKQITPTMMLTDRTFDTETCRVTAPRRLVALQWDDPVQLLRVTCDDEGEMSSLYVIVPAVTDQP